MLNWKLFFLNWNVCHQIRYVLIYGAVTASLACFQFFMIILKHFVKGYDFMQPCLHHLNTWIFKIWHELGFLNAKASHPYKTGTSGEFSSQRPIMRSYDAFFDFRLNKGLSKPSIRRLFETPSRSFWRHCNAWPGYLRLPYNCSYHIFVHIFL